MTLLSRLTAIAALCLCTACGFEPLYAVDGANSGNSLRNMYLVSLSGDEGAVPYVRDAFRTRAATIRNDARYELVIKAEESAAPLAIQTDASVTRFNYRLIGSYRLKDLMAKRNLAGSTTAIASFNVVNSQYSTLTAERTARRKAAQLLANQIEREILLQLARTDADTEKNQNRAADVEDSDADSTIETDDSVITIDRTDLYRDQPPDPFRE
ncbi:MAG: hypothetical protein AAF224_00445 [Pseudomonadota bacterium]